MEMFVTCPAVTLDWDGGGRRSTPPDVQGPADRALLTLWLPLPVSPTVGNAGPLHALRLLPGPCSPGRSMQLASSPPSVSVLQRLRALRLRLQSCQRGTLRVSQ